MYRSDSNQIQQVTDDHKSVIIQIATPYSVGTGFYLAQYDLIITNEHVVRDNKKVVIDGQSIDRQLVDVVFWDEIYDLAFLRAPSNHKMPTIHLSDLDVSEVGTLVIALGHPFGSQMHNKVGRLDSVVYDDSKIDYYQHSAALSPGNSGGPLLDANGTVIGVNTFLIQSGKDIGYALPLYKLRESLDAYLQAKSELVKCGECFTLIKDPNDGSQNCTRCGAKISYISTILPYEPLGINQQLEEMLTELGYDATIARRGPYNWEVQHGSALIHITYHERTGTINADAHLCRLPDDNILPLYQFLLKTNYILEGLSFTTKDNEVILSLLIFDQYLNKISSLRLFNHLFEMSDHYDDILVDTYNAKWLTF